MYRWEATWGAGGKKYWNLYDTSDGRIVDVLEKYADGTWKWGREAYIDESSAKKAAEKAWGM